MTDIKQTLAAAFTDEPPQAIDKPAIRRAGRRKVATRYASVGAAVVVALAVATVPINMAVGGGGGPDAGQASTAESPTLVLRTGWPQTGFPQTIVVADKPLDPGITDERAAELTVILRDSGAVPPTLRTHNPEGAEHDPWELERDPWEFGAWRNFYRAHAEVFDARGSAVVQVMLLSDPFGGCEVASVQSAGRTCEARTTPDGREYKIEFAPDVAGQLLQVTSKLPDGKQLQVTSQAIEDRSQGPYNTTPVIGGTQPLTVDELVKLATVPGLVF